VAVVSVLALASVAGMAVARAENLDRVPRQEVPAAPKLPPRGR
jgi:hypothetical protein